MVRDARNHQVSSPAGFPVLLQSHETQWVNEERVTTRRRRLGEALRVPSTLVRGDPQSRRVDRFVLLRYATPSLLQYLPQSVTVGFEPVCQRQRNPNRRLFVPVGGGSEDSWTEQIGGCGDWKEVLHEEEE